MYIVIVYAYDYIYIYGTKFVHYIIIINDNTELTMPAKNFYKWIARTVDHPVDDNARIFPQLLWVVYTVHAVYRVTYICFMQDLGIFVIRPPGPVKVHCFPTYVI